VSSSKEYRGNALACFQHAEEAEDASAKLHWLILADGWSNLADNVEKKRSPKPSSKPLFYSATQQGQSRY